ncbi:MAG: DUF1972 domain-containing protein [Pirellulales bacterium]|nr:DUF1972 domain-containing protein [Pirellulales bacterium]
MSSTLNPTDSAPQTFEPPQAPQAAVASVVDPPARSCRQLSILGTRGIPAQHGGFETFAQRLALHMVGRGCEVTVYCQGEPGSTPGESTWRGVRLINIPIGRTDAWGTIQFDWHAARRAAREGGTLLTLGYNTAAFSLWHILGRRSHLINMDGLEWQRQKWSRPQQAWLWFNERLACWWGNHLIADHPEIRTHLLTRAASDKITVIPYGADEVREADISPLARLGLQSRGYVLVIARPEPENLVREIVAAFSRRPRGQRLVVLGKFRPGESAYHRQVLEAASDEVLFPGAIYDPGVVASLRYYARLYVHGHTVGGTNPALVEALGAGCPVLAHDNRFNRWVAGPEAAYFADADAAATTFDELLADDVRLAHMRTASYERHAAEFTWARVLGEYERLLDAWS